MPGVRKMPEPMMMPTTIARPSAVRSWRRSTLAVMGTAKVAFEMTRLLDAAAGIPNATEPVPGLIAGGQPTAAHLTDLKAAGLVSVLDMRDPMEPRPYRTPDAVVAAGLTYVCVPVPHDPGSDDILSAIRKNVTELLANGPLLAHCNSGNRTGAALIPWFMVERKLSEDDAVNLALQMGTRNAGLLDWAMQYGRAQLDSR